MISHLENELLCRSGPGTPMGDLFRRFWLPVALSRELPNPDCPPVRAWEGFHLTGKIFEPVISPTIQALKEIKPKAIVPQHCTGWQAAFEITRDFPEAFVANSVGTRFVL